MSSTHDAARVDERRRRRHRHPRLEAVRGRHPARPAALARAVRHRHRPAHDHPRRLDREPGDPVGQGRARHRRRRPAVGRHRPTPSRSAACCCSAVASPTTSAASARSSSASSASPAPRRSAASPPPPTLLFAARGLQGVFAALLAPAALSLITVTFHEPKERARAFGVYGAIAGGGAALGLLLGGVLTEYLSWRWCLLVNVPIAIIAVLLAIPFVRESRADGAAQYDVLGAITVSVGLVALVYGFTKAAPHSYTESAHWTEPATLGVVRASRWSCWSASSSSRTGCRTRSCRCASCSTATVARPTSCRSSSASGSSRCSSSSASGCRS